MIDMTSTDLTPFLQRHERRSRRAFFAILIASLVVATVTFTYGALTTGAPAAMLANQWVSILAYPVFIVVFWTSTTHFGRTHPAQPDGRPPMNADDARSVMRVANAGFVFVACFGAIAIASQAGIALAHFGAMKPADVGRAALVANGALAVYFGNAWSRVPVPRGPEQKPATQMKFKRTFAWLIVIHGLLLALAGLFLSKPAMIITAGVVSISLVLSLVACVMIFGNALNSRSAS